MTSNPDYFRTLKVSKTFQIDGDGEDIDSVVRQLADFIERCSSKEDLSIRILLPREDGSGQRVRKWGASLRSGLILALKRKKIRPNLREVRYIHDEHHFGWVLIEPSLLDNLLIL